MAWYPSTSAQPQQLVYGASMVMSDDPAATAGCVKASATTPRASVPRRKTWTVRTYRLSSIRAPQTTAGRRTANIRPAVRCSDQPPKAAQLT